MNPTDESLSHLTYRFEELSKPENLPGGGQILSSYQIEISDSTTGKTVTQTCRDNTITHTISDSISGVSKQPCTHVEFYKMRTRVLKPNGSVKSGCQYDRIKFSEN